jgi:hypothetical protein
MINLSSAAVASNNDPIYRCALDRHLLWVHIRHPRPQRAETLNLEKRKPSMLRKCYSRLRVLDDVVRPETRKVLLQALAKLGHSS